MGSKVEKLVKSQIKQLLKIIVIVFVVSVLIAALAPSLVAGLAGTGISASAFTMATNVVVSSFVSIGMAITLGVGIYQSYLADEAAADARRAMEEEAKAAEETIEDHFYSMEADRYQEYDGPAIGITWDRATEIEFEEMSNGSVNEKDGSDPDLVSPESSFPLLFPLSLLGVLTYYGFVRS